MKSPFFHLVIWLVICVAAIAGYGFWYATVTNESATVAGLQNQINAAAQTSASVAASRSALAEISGDESLVESYFVPQTDIVSFIDNLQSLAAAQSATMKVLSVATGGTAKQSNLTLLFTISINGTFDAVMRTIGAIEYSPYDISTSKLSVLNDGKDAWSADLELVVGSVASTQATSTAPLQTSSTTAL